MSRSKSTSLSSARVFLWIKKSVATVAALVSGIQISPRFLAPYTTRYITPLQLCWKYVRRDKTSNKSAAVPLNDIKPVNQDLFDLHSDTVVPVTNQQNIAYDLSHVQIRTSLQIEAALKLASKPICVYVRKIWKRNYRACYFKLWTNRRNVRSSATLVKL